MTRKSLARQALERVGKNWGKGSGTRAKLLQNVAHFGKFIESRYHLERLENLKPHMIEAYASQMASRGLAPSTRADHMTAVRAVCEKIGKKGICSIDNDKYGIKRDRINPQQVNLEKLNEILNVLQSHTDGGDRVAMMMVAAFHVRQAFGVRAKESLLSSKVIEKMGKMYLVIEGAKGGRPRDLEVDNEAKLKAVELVKETSAALGSGTCRIIPPELTLKAAYDAQRNKWRALGGTRKAGANMHGQRHDVLRKMKADGATNAEIMDLAGHGQDRSPSAYLGKSK